MSIAGIFTLATPAIPDADGELWGSFHRTCLGVRDAFERRLPAAAPRAVTAGRSVVRAVEGEGSTVRFGAPVERRGFDVGDVHGVSRAG